MYDFILFFKYFYTFLCTHFDFNDFNLSSCKYFLKITALSLCTTLKKTHFIAWNCYLWSIRVHKLFFPPEQLLSCFLSALTGQGFYAARLACGTSLFVAL